METNINIAFRTVGGLEWYGGFAHIRNWVYAIKQTYGNNIGTEIFTFPTQRRWTIPWLFNALTRHTLFYDIGSEYFLKRHKINVLFGLNIQYKYGKIPTLSWIPDFQHIHFPQMFSASDRLDRTNSFLKTAMLSNTVILTSESVKKDFQLLAPKYAYKAKIVRTVSSIPKSVYKKDLKSVIKLYNLPEKFFYLPNQLYKHKNHELVFEVVRILKERGVKIFLVCTGYPKDYRHPGYSEYLFQKIAYWDIKDRVMYLGMIPYEHVLFLMRQSICVLNPSLFEGFGLTVDEARSLGKQVLVSDISAHREQNPPKSTFFNPYDAEELAEKMGKVWHETSPGPDTELEEKARRILPERIKESAYSFMSIVKEVIK